MPDGAYPQACVMKGVDVGEILAKVGNFET